MGSMLSIMGAASESDSGGAYISLGTMRYEEEAKAKLRGLRVDFN
jgi:hypothetical protein